MTKTRETGRLGRGFSDPNVARRAAHLLIKHGMNAGAAAKELRPNTLKTSGSIDNAGWRLMNTPEVQIELEKLIARDGVSLSDRDRFVAKLKEMFHDGTIEEQRIAAPILSKLYIVDSSKTEQSQTIRIAGLSEGLERMLPPDAPVPTRLTPELDNGNVTGQLSYKVDNGIVTALSPVTRTPDPASLGAPGEPDKDTKPGG